MASDNGKKVGDDQEVTPIEKIEDLQENHQKQYATIVDDLKKKLLTMYGRSRHGHIKIQGVPDTLLDKVDLMTPSRERTEALREEFRGSRRTLSSDSRR